MHHQYHMDSDSPSSARALDPVILWVSDDRTRRLAFLPHLHHNPQDPQACLSGQLCYQRKDRAGVFVDEPSLQLNRMRQGEWTRYRLSSKATLALFHTLQDLYRAYSEHGAPRGHTTLLVLDGDLSAEVEALGETHVGPLIAALMRRAARSDSPMRLIDELAALGTQPLIDLRNAIGIANLQAALARWETLAGSGESAWQDFFKENEWILGQAFSQPVILIRSGGTVRPDTLEGGERRIVDFVYANTLTRNLALVEIKTPETSLLANTPYRDGIYRPGTDLVGAVAQICAYRHNVKQYARTLLRGPDHPDLRTDPQCIVLIGHTDQLNSTDKLDSFEQYRRELRNVQVLTFNELRERAASILALLTGGSADAAAEERTRPPSAAGESAPCAKLPAR